jgi:2-polyprenyl-6-methoxyphenol hydroxylase-like FAD-dependent oxidoreductase
MKRALPESLVQSGETFVSFERDGNCVHAKFASGRVATADLLIGADGAWSAVRQQVLPDIHPTYAGYVAWRGLMPEKALSPAA